MKIVNSLVLVAAMILALAFGTVYAAPPSKPPGAFRYPKIELYTSPWCKSCGEASAYLTNNNIPFVKKDVFANEAYMDEMTTKYRSNAVPVIVIGNDEKVLKGFIVEAFQMAVRDVMAKRR